MKIAHLLLVHKAPAMVERLVKKMQHPAFYFFIHVDKKANKAAFEYLADIPNVIVLSNQIDVKWGGYSIVQATLYALNEALAYDVHFSTYTVMSGQDYPLLSNDALYRFYEHNAGKNFIYHEDENSEWWQTAYGRVDRYHLTDMNFKGKDRLAAFISSILPKRKIPFGGRLYGGPGSGWWSISAAAALYLTDLIEHDRKLEEFTKFTWAPDEFFIQTLILNSPLAEHTIIRNLWYMDWSEGKPSPKIFTAADFETLSQVPYIFARKFDSGVDNTILDLIDQWHAKQ